MQVSKLSSKVAALNTLAGYIDWVPMSHITAENCKLLRVLCLLLDEQELQLGAAECLHRRSAGK